VLIQPYRVDEIRFAWCYRVYLRWRTHRLRRYPALADLDNTALEALGRRFDMHVLEHRTDETDVLLLLSLNPRETVSGCASKWKGQISKRLRESLGLEKPTTLLSRGYFASTAGRSTSDSVEAYLNRQGEHHGYADRARPPVFVRQYAIGSADEERQKPAHACTRLRHHVVLATHYRRGIFGSEAGEVLAERWRPMLAEARAALLKISVLPDHVHAALQLHPGVAPADVIVRMMNVAQELMFDRFSSSVIQARVKRLWQPSAYLGSYGDLASPQVSNYMRNWNAMAANE
jgi:REP element-mobilizing transposase RayT